ncbi:hypothetical protein DCC81_04120 [Chitinophaga parva]|uniref:HTH araC/xylS-type domain-containing protein n=1 Tax=Chitinophaga parva TaxID=2169414 RepID=A0A2T7BLX2_9BACT|nr:helix-turn-helix domain-containing protein [Chitinophaga parva]PUZ28678.1 hypothetical protein DCC81_04120 [Chitinophaga parva]
MNYVIFLGLCQALIALFLLPASRAKRPANEWLRWLLACICLHLTFKFIIFTAVPFVEMRRTFNTFVGLAYGPLLWIFARKVHNDRFKPFRYWYIFLPAIVGAFGYLFVAISTMVRGQLPLVFLDVYNKYVLYCSYGMAVFPILTLRVSRRLSAFWNIERRLLRQFSVILVSLSCIAVTGTLLPYVNGLGLDPDVTNIAIRIFVYAQLMVGCVLIIQYELSLQRILGQTTPPAALPEEAVPPAAVGAFAAGALIPHPTRPVVIHTEMPPGPAPLAAGPHTLLVIAEANPEEEAPARKSLLDADQLMALKMRLIQLMEKQKIYTDPDLSLEKLAALLQVPRNQASELINTGVGKSFYQFVNEYRIREVVRLLDKCIRHGATPNILSLAFEAGFHSKSSFNGYFKKVTGYTPSAYLKRDHVTRLLAQTGYR